METRNDESTRDCRGCGLSFTERKVGLVNVMDMHALMLCLADCVCSDSRPRKGSEPDDLSGSGR